MTPGTVDLMMMLTKVDEVSSPTSKWGHWQHAEIRFCNYWDPTLWDVDKIMH
jgi:hypothetical protein